MSSYLFGQFLLEEGVVNPDQLYAALNYQHQNNKVLGELAREKNLLTEQQVAQILEWQLCEDADFGEAAVSMGMLDQAGLDRLLKLQEEKYIHLGEALVAIGAVGQEEMDRELERFGSERTESQEEGTGEEEAGEDDTPMAVWSAFTRVLPRFTGGEVISGGFYPTIDVPPKGNRYILAVGGDMNFELAIQIQPDIEELIRHSVGGRDKPTAVQDLLKSVLEVYCSSMEPSGVAISPLGKAAKISEKELAERRKKAAGTSCVEIFLIQPPLLDGEFYQINGCLLLED